MLTPCLYSFSTVPYSVLMRYSFDVYRVFVQCLYSTCTVLVQYLYITCTVLAQYLHSTHGIQAALLSVLKEVIFVLLKVWHRSLSLLPPKYRVFQSQNPKTNRRSHQSQVTSEARLPIPRLLHITLVCLSMEIITVTMDTVR